MLALPGTKNSDLLYLVSSDPRWNESDTSYDVRRKEESVALAVQEEGSSHTVYPMSLIHYIL